jgi:hypothetical protein
MAESRVCEHPALNLPNWRKVACPECPPHDVNLVEAHVPSRTLQELGAKSIADLSDRQIHRLAAVGRASIPSVCIDCED